MTTPVVTPAQDPDRVWVLVGLMALVAGSITWFLVPPDIHRADVLPAIGIALGFAAAERWVVSIRLSDRNQSLTLSELPLVVGLFVLNPTALIAARMIGTIPSLVVSRKQASFKVAFNVVHQWIETLAALGVLYVIGPAGPLDGERAALTGLLVPVVTTGTAAFGVVAARSTLDGRWHSGQFLEMARQSIGPCVATAGFAVVALALAQASPWLLWAPATTVLVLYGAYRTHVRLMHLTDRQAHILRFTSETTGREGHTSTAGKIIATASTLTGVASAGLAVVDDGLVERWLAVTGDEGRLRQGLRTVRPQIRDDAEEGDLSSPTFVSVGGMHVWALDETGRTVLAVDLVGTHDIAGDLLRTLDQVANHARVVIANAAHAAALEQQAREADARALVDELTELPNRTALLQGIDRALASGRPFATVLVDLDDFKEINDALGHAAGDRVLQQVTARMGTLADEVLMLARLGGDEFAVLVTGGEAVARELADRLLELIRRPVDVPPYTLEVDASAGIALHPDHGENRDQLLRNADLAMYEAKGTSTSVAVFGAAAAGRAVRHLAISTSFRAAIGTDQLMEVYQPKVDLRSGRIVGVEALARWTHPDLGSVSPDEFIRVAEQAGLLPQLTEHVMDSALRWQRLWARAGTDINVAVNISAQGLLDSELPPTVARLLDRYTVPADRLTLEITESSVISDPQRTLAVLGRLSRLGVRISIDDFGTGYSSLAYLQELPADEIKIDKSFVQPMGADASATPLVNGVIRLCHELGFSVVAEGIETAAVQSLLRRMGCDAGQGFHIAHPMPPEQLLGWARSHAPSPPESGLLGDDTMLWLPET